ncbi:MAG TPA: GH3 auxin-responsive promoter family protein [Gemmataceae bacterium]|nr:GH3 auxin-responsive promoter family protein [Gemmataceae bacterium]
MGWKSVQDRLADTRLARQVTEAVYGAHSRRHLARFDQSAPARCQARTLLGLIHRARGTRFGRDHDFRRVRTVADFRRLVPLCTPADLWRSYHQPTYPRPFVLSAALQAARRAAWTTALALVLHHRPRSPLFAGRMLFLGEGVTAADLPRVVRPYALCQPGGSDTALRLLAERAARLRLTLLAGPAERLVPLLEYVRNAGQGDLARVWPNLSAVLYTLRSPAASADRLRAAVGDGPLLLETAFRAEGPLAVEDPRRGGLRLLPDHGVFFEFVPAEEAGRPHARRFGLEDVEPGGLYELALTTPAGLWACRSGLTVRLERRDLPLVRFVEVVPARGDERVTAIPPPHRQTADSPAALPESFVRSPWSVPADRG